MPASIINCQNPNDADIVIIGANYDVTSSFGKGADKGPAAIVECLNNQIEFYERLTRTTPVDSTKIAYHDLGDLNNLSPEDMVERVKQEYEKLLNQNKFLFLLGGEHSVTNAPLQAITKHESPSNVTVFWVDAHFDLRDSDADYNDEPFGKYAHSAVLHRIVELGYRVVHVGARAYSKEEYDFAKQKGVAIFEWGGKVPNIADIIGAVKTEKVYISIDVDGLDPAHMPATGTPVQGGLEWYYTLHLLQELAQKHTIIGADIVEVAPRSADKLTEYGAAQLCYNIIAYKSLK